MRCAKVPTPIRNGLRISSADTTGGSIIFGLPCRDDDRKEIDACWDAERIRLRRRTGTQQGFAHGESESGAGSERLESRGRQGPLDPVDVQQIFVDELPHVLALGDIELEKKVPCAARRIEFRVDFAQNNLLGHIVGRSRLAAQLDEYANGH